MRMMIFRSGIMLFLVGATFGPSAGCVAVHPAMGGRAQPGSAGGAFEEVAENQQADIAAQDPPEKNPASSDRWPDRWGQPDAPRGVIVPSEHRVSDLHPAHLGRFHHLRTGQTEYEHASALAAGVGMTDGFRFEPEGPGALVFVPPLEPPDPERLRTPDDASGVFVFVSGRLIEQDAGPDAELDVGPVAGPGDDEDRVALERTWFAYYDPRTQEAAGTIVLIPGMLGTPQPIIEGMIRHWRAEGYAVLRFLAHPSRFTERLEVAVNQGDEKALGRRLAAVYDQRTAECAYAADAAVAHIMSKREALKDKPVVLVGMSGGAMVLPTVYAYAPERYDAAVLIAGGGNFLRISAESNYAEWIDAVVMDWAPDDPGSTGDINPEQLDRVSDAYMRASRLDSLHTADELSGIPVLVLHAANDEAVPAALGDALWQRLGTPERWVFPASHELIFMMLPTQAQRLSRWLEDALKEDG